MTRFLCVLALLTTAAVLAIPTLTPLAASPQAPVATFNKDVLPILQESCQVCHRPGEVAPMSFLSYESTRPWAKAIKSAVVSKKMPPWFGDSDYVGFRNAPKLTQADIRTLSAWADSGAPEGDAKDKPASVAWQEGWRTRPDVIVSMPTAHPVPAKGAGEIKAFMIPSPFKEDTWVESIEIRPGDPSVVHHVIVQIPEEKIAADQGWGGVSCLTCTVPFSSLQSLLGNVRTRPNDGDNNGGVGNNGGGYPGQRSEPRLNGTAPGITAPGIASVIPGLVADAKPARVSGTFATMEAVYVPGSPPMDFRFHNSAKLIRGGSDIRIEVHYTPNGKKTSDQTKVGFTLAKGPTTRRFVNMAPTSLVDSRRRIPAGVSNWEEAGELTFTQDAELVWFMPHMHLRGKDMSFKLIYPNGFTDTVLRARFNFDWQLGYELEEPIKVPKGTRMIVTAHYDNSENNPRNPDPTKEVVWGDLTSNEMMIPWFGVVVNRDADPAMIATYGPAVSRAPATSAPSPSRSTPARLPTPGFIPDPSRLQR